MRAIGAALAAGALAACAPMGPPPLYHWDGFARQQYEALLGSTASPDEQIRALQAQVEKAAAAGAALPPGFRAHLGLLHLETGDADAARRWWRAEKASFPESAPFMDRLLERLDHAAKTGSPA